MKILQSISALFLGGLMLFSVTGVRISQHWCGNQLVNASIWGDAEPCAHFKAEGKPACPMHSNQGKKKNCCDEREVIIEGGDDDFQSHAYVIQAPLNCVVQAFKTTEHLTYSFKKESNHFHNHSPPLIGPPLYVKVQSFLI